MIIYCSKDLLFATKIGSTADALGVENRPARDADALGKRLDQLDDGKCNDAVTAVFVDLQMGPIAIDLITQTKAHTATITVIAFGRHTDVDLLAQASKRGSDHVLVRSEFVVQLPQLLQQYA